MINKKIMNIKLLILSDIHLDRVNDVKKAFLLSSINERIIKTRKNGFEPLVVFAGDINNSTSGYEFMQKINANIVYIAGNHEFWENDYYETIAKLKEKSPSNVKFLHNDVVCVGQYVILGATLWTDVGQGLNKDLFIYAGSRMNDMSFITAKDWYDQPENIQRLESIFSGYNILEKTNQKKWNALVEIDENQKSWDFLNCAGNVLLAIHKVHEIHKKAAKDLTTKQSWWRIDKKIFAETENKINFKEKNLTWEKFIDNLFYLYKNYSISQEEKKNFLKDSEKKNAFFQKIRFIENIAQKEIVILSHHLPFYEELLVGSVHVDNNNYPVRLHNQYDSNIFLIRHGEDYPEFNYLLRSSKGDIERHKDITHIVNYYNDGSNKLNSFLLENTALWIHGHEHHFKYSDYVKGIRIAANPSGSSLGVFEQKENDELKLNPHYLIYNKIKEEDYQKEFEKIKNSLVYVPEQSIAKDLLQEAVQLWALKYYNWEEHVKLLHKIEKSSKELLLLSIDYLQKYGASTESENLDLSNLEDNINFWNDVYNYNCQKLEQLHHNLILAYSVRVEKRFNFQAYGTNSIMTMIDISNWTMGNATAPELIDNGVVGIFSAKKSFESKANVKIAIKYAEKISEFLDGKNFKYVYQVKKEDIDEFNTLSSIALEKERVIEKINEKWNSFISKALELDNDFEKKDRLDF